MYDRALELLLYCVGTICVGALVVQTRAAATSMEPTGR